MLPYVAVTLGCFRWALAMASASTYRKNRLLLGALSVVHWSKWSKYYEETTFPIDVECAVGVDVGIAFDPFVECGR